MKFKIANSKNIEEIKFDAVLMPDISYAVVINQEPFLFRFIPSGWTIPQRYHVLIEWGDTEEVTHKGLMTVNQIKEEYGIDLPGKERPTIRKMIEETPNDTELGNMIRNFYKENKKDVKI